MDLFILIRNYPSIMFYNLIAPMLSNKIPNYVHKHSFEIYPRSIYFPLDKGFILKAAR